MTPCNTLALFLHKLAVGMLLLSLFASTEAVFLLFQRWSYFAGWKSRNFDLGPIQPPLSGSSEEPNDPAQYIGSFPSQLGSQDASVESICFN